MPAYPRLRSLPRRLGVSVLVLALPGVAAAVTITDCVNDPAIVVQSGTKTTRIEVAPDDLVIACPLVPLGNTNKLVLSGADVTIRGPAGTVSADGAGPAVRITATGTLTADQTSLEASDGNGAMDVVAAGDVVLTSSSLTVGGGASGGDLLLIECTGQAPDCAIRATDTSLKGRQVDVLAVGDVTFRGVTLTTNSPRDRVEIISSNGDVDLGAGAAGPVTPGPLCAGPGMGPGGTANVILGGPESDLVISAFGFVDLSAIRITVAQNIFVTAGVGAGAAPGPAFIALNGATIRNDIGKKGEIVMLADEALGTIDITDVVLIDDDESGSSVDLAELNGCATLPRTGCPNVVGTASIDG